MTRIIYYYFYLSSIIFLLLSFLILDIPFFKAVQREEDRDYKKKNEKKMKCFSEVQEYMYMIACIE